MPRAGDVAEIVVPERRHHGDPDHDGPREQLALLTVERLDGLRIDRLSLRLLGHAGEHASDHETSPGSVQAGEDS
jgi:hypothetical protein